MCFYWVGMLPLVTSTRKIFWLFCGTNYVYLYRTLCALDVIPSQVYSLVGSSPLHASTSYNTLLPIQEQRQPIIIPDTPSPPVSVITIRSDTDEEEDSKYKPGR